MSRFFGVLRNDCQDFQRSPFGNPTYDWAKDRTLVPRDESTAKFFPPMTVRAEDGEGYALGRAEEGGVFERASLLVGNTRCAKYTSEGEGGL